MENGWTMMNSTKHEVWGFNYSYMVDLNVKKLGVIKLNLDDASPNTFKSRREALEALAKRLNELLHEDDIIPVCKNCDCPTLTTWSDV